MVSGQSSGGFCSQFIQLTGGDPFVDAGTDLLSDQNGIAVLSAQTITEFLKTRSYLIKMYCFLAAISLHHIHRVFLKFDWRLSSNSFGTEVSVIYSDEMRVDDGGAVCRISKLGLFSFFFGLKSIECVGEL